MQTLTVQQLHKQSREPVSGAQQQHGYKTNNAGPAASLCRRGLLQYEAGFPWPTIDMVPVPSTCNKTGNSTIELFFTYSWPASATGPYCFKVWTNPAMSGSALGEITAPLNGQVSDAASFVKVLALGFEVGKCVALVLCGLTVHNTPP